MAGMERVCVKSSRLRGRIGRVSNNNRGTRSYRQIRNKNRDLMRLEEVSTAVMIIVMVLR